MIDNPFRKKTASERLAENARTRFSAAADASRDAGLRAKEVGGHTAEGVSASARSAGAALGAVVPTVAAAFANARSRTAHGISAGVDHSAHTLSDGLDAAPEKVDHARDWIVDELLPRLQQMVDGTVDAKNDAADRDGALSALAGETVRRPKRKGGVLMVLGLALLGGAGYFWYTDQKRKQGDPWQKVSRDEAAFGSERRAVSAAANPGAGMRPSHQEPVEAHAGEKVHLTPSEAAAAREEIDERRPVSALASERPATTAPASGTTAAAAGTTGPRTAAPATGAAGTTTPAASTTPAAGAGLTNTQATHTEQQTTERTTVERRPVNEKVAETRVDDARVERTTAVRADQGERRLDNDAATGPIATGYAAKADDLAGDNAPTQSIPTVGERLNPADAKPSRNNVDPYGTPKPAADPIADGDEKWRRN